jgi:hypothetical protein
MLGRPPDGNSAFMAIVFGQFKSIDQQNVARLEFLRSTQAALRAAR